MKICKRGSLRAAAFVLALLLAAGGVRAESGPAVD